MFRSIKFVYIWKFVIKINVPAGRFRVSVLLLQSDWPGGKINPQKYQVQIRFLLPDVFIDLNLLTSTNFCFRYNETFY